MAGTSLTGIFAPGSPALIESLRTLTLDPKRAIGPGETVTAEFSFSNFGGAPATGLRVRFSHPQGATHVAEADLVDGRPLDAGATLVAATGAPVGDLEPHGTRKVSARFRVNDTIEDGTELVFQAALISDQTALIATNIEKIAVRSRPVLANASTLVTLSAPDRPRPGDTISVHATVANTGSSSANDVVVLLPAPEHTTYVARSARIDGRVVPNVDGNPFDYDHAVVASQRLGPGQSVAIEFAAVVDSPLSDGTRVKASGAVGAREIAEFAIASADVFVASPPDFSGEETTLSLACDDAVTPGMRIPMVLRAVNVGTGAADAISVAFALPEGLAYAPGSAHVDGQPVSDESIPGLTFSLGSLAAGRTVEAGLTATVTVPMPDADVALPVEAALRWKGGERDFARRLTARVGSRFNRARNFVEADRGVAHAGDEVRFLVHVYNDGTAPESGLRLRALAGVHLGDVRIGESDDELVPYRDALDLGLVAPHYERVFTVAARVGTRVPDHSNVTLGAVLEQESGAIDLGTATIVVRSRPRVVPEGTVWEMISNEPLRPLRFGDVLVRFTNSGSDVLRDARLALTLPKELAVERAVDARRDRGGLYFGDIPAETTHEARITLRLLRPVPNDRPLVLEGWLHGKGISPVQLPPLDVATFAEPQFAQSAQMFVSPTESVNSGERVYYEIRLRNDGDGPAQRLSVRVVPTNLAVYVPSSTTLNGMAVSDDSGQSQLWSQRGLALADVNPGVELRIRWEMSVFSPLAAGTPLDARAVLDWDDGQTLALAAPTLRVVAEPTLGETSIGTPISVARAFAAKEKEPAFEAAAPEPPAPPPAKPIAIAAAPPVETPEPAAPQPPRAIVDMIAAHAERLEQLPPPPVIAATPSPAAPAPPLVSPYLYVDFSNERLDTTLRMLDRADAGGLIQHMFAMRLLAPENAVAGSAALGQSLTSATATLRAPLDRFFVRLRMPRVAITAKDLEDRESRFALRGLLDNLLLAPNAEPLQPPTGVVRLEGPIDLDLLRALSPELDESPLGAVTPWVIAAQMLGNTIQKDGMADGALGAYRAELLNVLTVLSELPIDEFHRVLTTSVNRTLDESLASVIGVLRGSARLTVE